ncbi:MAG TPA: hypothetical protein VG410_00175 [Solirubrobacteraceae bacterium]|jgi:hypothetical protein|nr:hypothetical protein [Solirubrobacteraceae bacterium]
MRRALLVGLALTALAGCGSSSLSDHDLRADAAVACRHASQRLSRIIQPASATAALPFLRRGIAVLGPELAALRRLAPGTDLSAAYHATVANFGAAVQRVRGTVAVLTSGGDPVASFTTLEHELTPIVAGENAGWRRLQIPACVSR